MPSVQIVSFDLPVSPLYGGTFLIRQTIKLLHANGVSVILHAFVYGDKTISESLKEECSQIFLYNRHQYIRHQFSKLPFIIKSRESVQLIQNLKLSAAPILLEGIHCAAILERSSIKENRIFLRWHNIESDYYCNLYKLDTTWRRFYYLLESYKLRAWEIKIKSRKGVKHIFIRKSESDKMQLESSSLIPPLHGNKISFQHQKEEYALFHGKLSVLDNEKAAVFFINQWKKINIPLIIAGAYPRKSLKKMIEKHPSVSLIDTPSYDEMNQLIEKAKYHVLWSFQNNGIKLKLLNALYSGGIVFANKNVYKGTNLNEVVIKVNEHNFTDKFLYSLNSNIDDEYIKKRIDILNKNYSDKLNITKLINVLVGN